MSDDGTKTPGPSDATGDPTILKQREIEARVLGPVLKALATEFGEERVRQIASDAIAEIARAQGAALRKEVPGGLCSFAELLPLWQRDGGIEIEILERNEERLSFNVVRCRFAEMYRELGLSDMGALLSCSRDFNLIAGFDPGAKLERTQTIMQGAPFCDFRFRQTSDYNGGTK
jgi:hypothetical protein